MFELAIGEVVMVCLGSLKPSWIRVLAKWSGRSGILPSLIVAEGPEIFALSWTMRAMRNMPFRHLMAVLTVMVSFMKLSRDEVIGVIER
jgi:hypothetical protein